MSPAQTKTTSSASPVSSHTNRSLHLSNPSYPVLVDLTPLNEGDEPIFYPVNYDDLVLYDKSLPPTPMADSNTNGTAFPELPPAPPSHQFGHGYSSNHPIPTVQSYKLAKEENVEKANQYAEIVAKRQAEADERTKRSEEARRERENDSANGANNVDGAMADVKRSEGQDSNLANNTDKKHNTSSSKPATEKQRMMEQMNSNQSESGGMQPVCREAKSSATDRQAEKRRKG